MVIAGILVAIAAAALAVSLIPPVYTANASFVAIASASGLKLPSGMGNLGGLGGFASQLGLGDPQDPSESPAFYNRLISSRELRTRLLQSRFADPRSASEGDSARLVDLMRIRNKDPQRRMELALRALERTMRVRHEDRTSMVFLATSTEWPGLSSAVANRTLELVGDFNQEQRRSRAGSKREFLERRVDYARSELSAAEDRQRRFLEENRVRRSSPTLLLIEEQHQREVDRAASLYLALQQQLEAARLEEVNDAALITVVDSAVTPRKAAWPRYGLLAMSTLIAGLILGVMLAGVATVLADWRAGHPQSDSELRGAVRAMRREIGGRLSLRRASERPARH
jgi:uncharacterized protein involved in exopolysaccharide biosynthesis